MDIGKYPGPILPRESGGYAPDLLDARQVLLVKEVANVQRQGVVAAIKPQRGVIDRRAAERDPVRVVRTRS